MSVAFDPAPAEPGAAPVFPPLLSGVAVAAGADPMAKAIGAAASGVDAGAVFWSEREDRLDAAVVFAPETPLRTALAMVIAAEVALGDALGALAPPEVGVTWVWPDRARVNGADAGVFRAAASTRDLDAVPNWLAVAATVQIASLFDDGVTGIEPGRRPDLTSLYDEGCATISRTRLLESWSRHLLHWVHRWEADGLRPLHDAWRGRAEGIGATGRFQIGGRAEEGVFVGLDEDGALLLRDASGAATALALAEMLDAPRTWPPAD